MKQDVQVKINQEDVKDNIELPKADKYIVDDNVVQGGRQKDSNDLKDKNVDSIEIISQDGKGSRIFPDKLHVLEVFSSSLLLCYCCHWACSCLLGLLFIDFSLFSV